MAPEKRTYRILTDEGAAMANREFPTPAEEPAHSVGDEVELPLYADQRTALLAAEWLEEIEDKKPSDKGKG